MLGFGNLELILNDGAAIGLGFLPLVFIRSTRSGSRVTHAQG